MKEPQKKLTTLGVILFLIGLLAVCTTFILPNVIPNTDIAKSQIARGDIAGLHMVCRLLRLHCNRFPSNTNGLSELLTNPGYTNWQGPYLEQDPIDPWGNPYRYSKLPDKLPSIVSAGPDGELGTQDDVDNP